MLRWMPLRRLQQFFWKKDRCDFTATANSICFLVVNWFFSVDGSAELIYRSRANGLVTPTYVLADITNLSPIPHSHTGIISSSALRASQVDPNQGSNVHTLTGYLGFNNSPANHSPKLCGNKGLAELSSVSPDSFLFSKWKENVSPDIINNISTSVSPNQKQQLSSRSPSGLRSRRKFILRNVSPFPPLTPFSSSKGGGMHKNESSSQWLHCMFSGTRTAWSRHYKQFDTSILTRK